MTDPLATSHGRYTRVDVWYGGQYVTTIPNASGTVTVNARSRVRRTLEAAVPEAYWPTADTDALMPYGGQLRVFQGITDTRGQLLLPEYPVFAGRIEEIDREKFSGQVAIAAEDPFVDVEDGQFETPRAVAAGTGVVGNIIGLIAEQVPAAVFVDLTGSPATVPAGILFNQDRGQAIDDLAASIGAEVFFKPDGVTCVIRPVPSLAGSPAAAWTLKDGQGGTIVSDQAKRSRTDVPNRIVVHAELPGQTPILSVVTDDFAGSITRYGGPYGKVVRHYNNWLINSAGQAQQAGMAQLGRYIGATRTRTIGLVPNPGIEGGDILKIATSDGTEMHIADDFTLPFSVDTPMTINTRSTVNAVTE